MLSLPSGVYYIVWIKYIKKYKIYKSSSAIIQINVLESFFKVLIGFASDTTNVNHKFLTPVEGDDYM